MDHSKLTHRKRKFTINYTRTVTVECRYCKYRQFISLCTCSTCRWVVAYASGLCLLSMLATFAGRRSKFTSRPFWHSAPLRRAVRVITGFEPGTFGLECPQGRDEPVVRIRGMTGFLARRPYRLVSLMH